VVGMDLFDFTILFYALLFVFVFFLIIYLWKKIGIELRYCPKCHTKLVLSLEDNKRHCPNCDWVNQDEA
jgi:hypothetical protein